MNLSLIKYLKCVDCHNDDFEINSIKSNKLKQIVIGYISCKNCKSIYPIIERVLVIFKRDVLESFLLPKEIEIIDKYSIPIIFTKNSDLSRFERDQVKTHKNWSFQWLEMDTDTYEEDWGKPLGDLGEFHYYDIPIKPEDYNDKMVCEASCGYGGGNKSSTTEGIQIYCF